MSVDATLAVLYAQSGLSTNIANAAMVAPQAATAMSRLLAAEQAKLEREQVEKGDKTERKNIGKDGGGNRGLFLSRRARVNREVMEEEEIAQPKSAIVGNLLNVKV